jgi:hypothetical protein
VRPRRPSRWAGEPAGISLDAPRHTRLWPVIALVAVAIAGACAALLGGWWIAGKLRSPAPPPAPAVERTTTLGPATIVTTNDWTPVRRAPGIQGLDRRRTAVLQPSPGAPAEIILTIAPAEDVTLIPAPMREALLAPPGAPTAAVVAGQRAWSYPAQPATRNRVMDVLVLPTTAGVLAVACVSPYSWTATGDCASGIDRVSLRSGAWLRPRDDLAVRTALPGVVGPLERERGALRARLHGARTVPAQRALAQRLATAYGTAAQKLAPLSPKDGPAAAIAPAFQRCERAYLGFARAGRGSDHAAARRAVAAAEDAARAALARVAAASPGR